MSESAVLPASPLPPASVFPSEDASYTPLTSFPDDATLHIWRKPATGVEPVDGGELHVSELIPSTGDHVLVCFATMATDEWEPMREQLRIGMKLGLSPVVVGAVDRTHVSSGLWGTNSLAGSHGLTDQPRHPTVFTPSNTLMKILGIDRSSIRTRNALVLIRNGRVIATWVSSGDDGNKPHDWTMIISLVN